MIVKIFGAVLIIVGCAGVGYSLAAAHKKEEKALQALISSIEIMISELEFRLTPLPQLVRLAGETEGIVGEILTKLAARLEENQQQDAAACMAQILSGYENIPHRTRHNLVQMGHTLGRFGLSGQVNGFRGISQLCRRDLESLTLDRDARLRGYRTLGICAGVALVILFI